MQAGDFRIDFNGTWFHGGEEIRREALVRLFAERALRIDEDGCYWLSTPHERHRVTVEDVPFLIVDAQETPEGLALVTNTGERACLPKGEKPEMRRNEKAGMNLPYVHIRNGLYARFSRAVYHELADRYGEDFFS